MKIDYNQDLLGIDGNKFTLEGIHGHLTVGKALIAACSMSLPGDESLAPMDKYEVGKIGHLVAKGLDLTVDQLKTVKDRCGKAFVPMLVFDLFNKIEGTEV